MVRSITKIVPEDGVCDITFVAFDTYKNLGKIVLVNPDVIEHKEYLLQCVRIAYGNPDRLETKTAHAQAKSPAAKLEEAQSYVIDDPHRDVSERNQTR